MNSPSNWDIYQELVIFDCKTMPLTVGIRHQINHKTGNLQSVLPSRFVRQWWQRTWGIGQPMTSATQAQDMRGNIHLTASWTPRNQRQKNPDNQDGMKLTGKKVKYMIVIESMLSSEGLHPLTDEGDAETHNQKN